MKKSYLKAEKHSPYKHDLGQNFLYDRDLLAHLVAETGLTAENDVLEIGPGAGTLTECLCEAGRNVISVEVDHDLVPVLKLMEERYPRLTIVEGDIRRIAFDEVTAPLEKPFQVIANIPYNITTPILDLLFEHRAVLSSASLMVQKEVAEKMMACPGDELYGILSVKCRYYSEIRLIEVVPAECFTPPPKVDSAFVKLDFSLAERERAMNEDHLFSLVKTGFGLRRKTLANALKAHPDATQVIPALEEMGRLPTVRAEELDVPDWICLSNLILRQRG